ncbi:hypothetical protein CEXT_626501 [Caerostris extrusa]|uniref:Uncharacterized protein n=1 Tax=Caerostris extrusa TaxID=172846 RepID=A0AAV4Q712_CAEEX|nr:hypothetical protein CEXT_626501 [Caerostris extrusa]
MNLLRGSIVIPMYLSFQRFPSIVQTRGTFAATLANAFLRLRRCNGVQDCSDNSDEEGCSTIHCDPGSQLQCDGTKCVPLYWACDGSLDCDDGTDEKDCCE